MKIVIVLDEKLPAGIMANTSAALAMSCCRKIPGIIGKDVTDADMNIHPGLLTMPVPVLSSNAEQLGEIKRTASDAGLDVIGFTDIAARSRSYDSYIESMASSGSADLKYLGLCIFGDTGKVRSITGALPLVK